MWRMLQAYRAELVGHVHCLTAHWDTDTLCISLHLNNLSTSCTSLSIDLAAQAPHTYWATHFLQALQREQPILSRTITGAIRTDVHEARQ